jgi:hypothetical protein
MFFMPEYYPHQILLSGAFPENFLSAVLGRIVTGRPRGERGRPDQLFRRGLVPGR